MAAMFIGGLAFACALIAAAGMQYVVYQQEAKAYALLSVMLAAIAWWLW